MNNVCRHCGTQIEIAIFKGGGWCSENCRKALLTKQEALVEALQPVYRKLNNSRQEIVEENGYRVEDSDA